MIEYTKGNILESSARYIVVPVNCVGKPGKGLAQQWVENAPEACVKYYIKKCLAGDIEPGHIMTFEDSCYILATTKNHWFYPSEYEWIESICQSLYYFAIEKKIWRHDNEDMNTIAVPKLGCGLGRLKWPLVHQIMQYNLEQVYTRFLIYI